MDYFTDPAKQPMTTCVILGLTLLVLLFKASSEHFDLISDAKQAAKDAACKLGIGKCEHFGLATDAAQMYCKQFPNAPGCKAAEQYRYQAAPSAVQFGQRVDQLTAQGVNALGQGLQNLGQGLQKLA